MPGPMDSYGDAGSTVDAQKSAMLTAIAQAGEAGRRTQQAAAADTAAQGRTAAGMALSAAQGPGAPQGTPPDFAAQLAQQASAPQAAAAAAPPAPDYSGALLRAGGDYFSALRAAIPISQSVTQRQVNSIQAEAEQRRLDREASRQSNVRKPYQLPNGRTVMATDAEIADFEFGSAMRGAEREEELGPWGNPNAKQQAVIASLNNPGWRGRASGLVSTILADARTERDAMGQVDAAEQQYREAKRLAEANPGKKLPPAYLDFNAIRNKVHQFFAPEGLAAKSMFQTDSERNRAKAAKRPLPTGKATNSVVTDRYGNKVYLRPGETFQQALRRLGLSYTPPR